MACFMADATMAWGANGKREASPSLTPTVARRSANDGLVAPPPKADALCSI